MRGRSVIGGPTVSTFFTLVLIPTLYVILEERFPRRFENLGAVESTSTPVGAGMTP